MVAWPHARVWRIVGRAKDTRFLVMGLDTSVWLFHYC